MKILFCPIATHGFVYPMIGIARVIQSRGHEVAFVTSPDFAHALEDAGLKRIPRGAGDGPSFGVADWALPQSIAMQVKHIEYALCRFRADVLVTSQLGHGALVIGELRRLPVAVLGLATYLWPSWPLDYKPQSEQERRLEWRYGDMLGHYNRARAILGLPASTADHLTNPLKGDLLMVQSVPELHENRFGLPPDVHFVGSCGWEPEVEDNELSSWIAESIAAAQPIIYTQPGRSFGNPGFWGPLCEALSGKPLRVLADIQREDGEVGEIPDNFYARPHIPQRKVLPFCSAVVTTGHTTSVLGALSHGLPSLLFPRGSASDDIAEHCDKAGVAICAYDYKHGVAPELVERAVGELLINRRLRERVKNMQAAFARAGGIERAAELIEQLGIANRQRDLPLGDSMILPEPAHASSADARG